MTKKEYLTHLAELRNEANMQIRKSGLGYAALAEHAGKNPSTVERFCTGKTRYIQLWTALSLVQALGGSFEVHWTARVAKSIQRTKVRV